MNLRLLACAALAASFCTLPALADAPMTPAAVLDKAATVDGATVTVAGTIQKYQLRNTPIGPVTTFGLCSENKRCVGVFETKSDERKNGDTATVTGTFHVNYTFHGHSISNVIVLDQ